MGFLFVLIIIVTCLMKLVSILNGAPELDDKGKDDSIYYSNLYARECARKSYDSTGRTIYAEDNAYDPNDDCWDDY